MGKFAAKKKKKGIFCNDLATISTSVVEGGVLFSSAACQEVDLAAVCNLLSMPGQETLIKFQVSGRGRRERRPSG